MNERPVGYMNANSQRQYSINGVLNVGGLQEFYRAEIMRALDDPSMRTQIGFYLEGGDVNTETEAGKALSRLMTIRQCLLPGYTEDSLTDAVRRDFVRHALPTGPDIGLLAAEEQYALER